MVKQLEEADEYSQYKVPRSLFRGVYLTAEGYRYLQLRPQEKPFDAKILDGMRAREAFSRPQCQAMGQGVPKTITR
jgi:hypothetical protein